MGEQAFSAWHPAFGHDGFVVAAYSPHGPDAKC